MKKLFILTALFTFSLSANSQPAPKAKWLTYETEEFSIDYSATWELNTEGIMGSSFFIFSPLDSYLDDFRDNLSLIKEDLSEVSMDLDDYVELSENQIQTVLKDGKIIKSKRQTANDLTFHNITYTGIQGEYDLRIQQYYWVVNKTAYVLTFTCKDEDSSKFERISQRLLNSFKLNTNYQAPPKEAKGNVSSNGTLTTYSTETFSVQYPDDWIINADGKLGMEFILFAPSSGEDDEINENITLVMEDISAYEMELEEYVNLSLSQIQKVVTDGKVIYNKEKIQDGTTYYQVISTGKQGTLDLKFNQYYWIIDGKAYVMTFTCHVDTFDEYRTIGETIMGSFKVF